MLSRQRSEFREYEYKIRVQNKYACIILCDEESPEEPEEICKQTLQQSVSTGDGMVCIRAMSEETLRVLVEVRESEPVSEYSDLFVLGEASLDAPSGRIILAGSGKYFPDAARIPVRPALYRLRAYAGSLDTAFSGTRRTQDHYRIVLWLF